MARALVLVESTSASIDTLSVTIKALHVNGKQMTLAVFRQLPVKNEASGCEYWGWVNYEVGDRSRWFVFSKGGRLFRRSIRDHVEFKQNLAADVRRWAQRRLFRPPQPQHKDPWMHEGEIYDSEDGLGRPRRASVEQWNEEVKLCNAKIAAAEKDDEETNKAEQERAATDARLFASLPQLFIAV